MANTTWRFDAVADCWVALDHGYAITPHALAEYGELAETHVKAGLIPDVPRDLMRIWFERRYGAFEDARPAVTTSA